MPGTVSALVLKDYLESALQWPLHYFLCATLSIFMSYCMHFYIFLYSTYEQPSEETTENQHTFK